MMKYLIEFVGTFIFLGVILNVVKNGGNWAPIAIGLTLSVVILWGGKISGGHYNPAVSFMFYLNKQLPKNDLICYIIAQILGGIFALQFSKKVYK